MSEMDLRAFIAAGGSTCKLCGGRMLKADGCTWGYVYCGGKYYKRIKYGAGYLEDGDIRCFDCGAKPGHYHHINCDMEYCPVCGEKMLGCSCDLVYAESALPSKR